MSLELKMTLESDKFDVNAISLENSSDEIRESQDEYYLDNKVCVSETTVSISNELLEYKENDEIKNYKMLSVDHIKTNLKTEVNNAVSNNVKIEHGVCPADIQIEFCNELLFCKNCHEVYQDYCTKCRMLVHILNKKPHNNSVRELPTFVLETRESTGNLGIFTLKVIPEDVRFGPFTGLKSTELSFRIKTGRFVVSDDKLEHLNWMQYINSASNTYEQNLFPYQYEGQLYYSSTRKIHEGEELLVYFGEEYEDNLKNMEMDFVPIAKNYIENVFACSFCCLGFSSKEYLAEHKAVSHGETNETFSVEVLARCPFCKIYLEAKEYFEHHMNYCCEADDRHCILATPEVHKLEVQKSSFVKGKSKRLKRRIYKCTRCKFRTMYKAYFRHHTNEHYKVKMYKCAICHRRYKTKESFKVHAKKIYANNEGDVQKYSMCDYLKRNIKNTIERSAHSQDGKKQCQSSNCKFQIRDKGHHSKSHIKIKHLKRGKYKCANCLFETHYRSCLVMHMKTKHLMESDYKCGKCEYKTNYKSSLKVHIKTKHLKQKEYKCAECEFKTSYKPSLQGHVKTKHLKERGYKCRECEYKTNYERCLKIHVNTKHLKVSDHKCTKCEFTTNYKYNLKIHIKTKHLKEYNHKCPKCKYETNWKSNLNIHVQKNHLKEKDYKCAQCKYQTKYKTNLEIHIKTKHLKVSDYRCMECEYKTNYKSSLERHMEAKHLKQNSYKCAQCEFVSYYKASLELHIKTKHVKENDYKCKECEYRTSYRISLEKHIKGKHLKQCDYKCPSCKFQTNWMSNLRKHMQVKHQDACKQQDDYKCAECEYQTKIKSHLKKHLTTKHRK